jgi:serine/threonine protein kinase
MLSSGEEPHVSLSQKSVKISNDEHTLQAGELIDGKYQVIRMLGRGGMGIVYEALHVALDKRVAIKFFDSMKATHPKAFLRFHVEARAASRLNHPSLVAVTDYGVSESNHTYLVMDLVDGESLAEYLEKHGQLDYDLAIHIMERLCDALGYAHKQGIVHRDLKPGNIMVSKTDDSLNVYIIDFGVAKMLIEDENFSSALTETGEIFGSPFYMSPEQCAGKKVGPQSDIYSLGCVMYACLAGRPPFMAENVLMTISMHLQDQPIKISSYRSDVPLLLEAIIAKALNKGLSERYQNAEQIIADLKILQSQQAGRTLSIASRLRSLLLNFGAMVGSVNGLKSGSSTTRNARFSKFSLILLCSIFMAMACALIWTQSPTHQPSSSNSEAPPSSEHSPNAIDEKPEVTWSKCDLLAQKAVDMGEYDKAQALYERSCNLAKAIGAQYELASVEGMSDLSVLMGKGGKDFEKDIDKLAHASIDSEALIKALSTASSKNVASTLIDQSNSVATFLNHSGRFAETQKVLKTAVAVGEKYLPADDPIKARCLLSLADSYRIQLLDQGTSPELAYRMKAFAIAKKHPHDEIFEACAYSIGRYYNVHEQSKLALPFLKQALDSATKNFGVPSMPVSKCCFQLAVCYRGLNQQALSNASAQQAFSNLQNLQPEKLSADSFHLLADLEAAMHRNGESIRDFTRSLQEYERGPAKDYPLIANCCKSLADILPPSSPQVNALHERRLVILRRIGDLSPSDECQSNKFLADRYFLQGKLSKDREVLRRSVAIVLKWPPHSLDRKYYVESALWLATDDIKDRDYKEAEKNADLFKSWVLQEFGPHTYMDAQADGLLGSIYVDTHRAKEGQALLQNALNFYRNYKPTASENAHYQESREKLIADLSKAKLEESAAVK